MMPPRRTITKDESSVFFRGEDHMTFYKPDQSPRKSFPVRAYISPGSVMDVPPHFHMTHDELFCIEQGKLQITQNGVAKTYDASSGEVIIPRGTIHSIHAEAPPGEAIITWEKTDPDDREKEVMFRVLNSSLHDSPVYRKTGKLSFGDALQLNLTFYEHDAYTSLLPVWTGKIGKWVSLLINGALAWIATLIGYKATYPEYVTEELLQSAKTGQKEL